MANGIGSADIVEAMARAGMLGFFGAAGPAAGTRRGGHRPHPTSLGDLPLRLQPHPQPQRAEHRSRPSSICTCAAASASSRRRRYLDLTLPVVRYRTAGIRRDRDGRDRRAEPRHRQGVARRGGVASSWPRRPERFLQRTGPARPPHGRAGRAGAAHPHGPGRDRGGRLRRPHRQPAGHHAAPDAARPARPHAGAVRLRRTAARRRGRRHRDAGLRRGGVR